MHRWHNRKTILHINVSSCLIHCYEYINQPLVKLLSSGASCKLDLFVKTLQSYSHSLCIFIPTMVWYDVTKLLSLVDRKWRLQWVLFFFLTYHLPLCHSFILQSPSLLSTLPFAFLFEKDSSSYVIRWLSASMMGISWPWHIRRTHILKDLTAGCTHTVHPDIFRWMWLIASGEFWFCYCCFLFFFIHSLPSFSLSALGLSLS